MSVQQDLEPQAMLRLVKDAIKAQDAVQWVSPGMTDRGSYESPLWRFTRHIKSMLPDADSERLWPQVSHKVKRIKGPWSRWETIQHALGEDEMGGPFTEADAQAEFVNCWEKIRHLEGDDLLCGCVEAGDKLLLAPPARSQHSQDPAYCRFISFCAQLQLLKYPKPIALPQRGVAEAFGMGRPNTIGIWIGWAIQDGLLTLKREHRYNPKRPSRSRARQYLFHLDAWEGKTRDRFLHAMSPRQRDCWYYRHPEDEEEPMMDGMTDIERANWEYRRKHPDGADGEDES
ncbi:MAG TPA: hypothetical protein VFH61_02000 [Thermoleophilia bacterium]|nr:hypothetical protein [Thermoleophilia bacterium]